MISSVKPHRALKTSVHKTVNCTDRLETLAAKMTKHDCNQNEELVLYCDLVSDRAVYRIQPGLTSGGFFRNRKKARKVLETRNKIHKEND